MFRENVYLGCLYNALILMSVFTVNVDGGYLYETPVIVKIRKIRKVSVSEMES